MLLKIFKSQQSFPAQVMEQQHWYDTLAFLIKINELHFYIDHGGQNIYWVSVKSLELHFYQGKKKTSTFIFYVDQLSRNPVAQEKSFLFFHPSQMVYVSHHFFNFILSKSLKEICKATVACCDVMCQPPPPFNLRALTRELFQTEKSLICKTLIYRVM